MCHGSSVAWSTVASCGLTLRVQMSSQDDMVPIPVGSPWSLSRAVDLYHCTDPQSWRSFAHRVDFYHKADFFAKFLSIEKYSFVRLTQGSVIYYGQATNAERLVQNKGSVNLSSLTLSHTKYI